MAVHETSTGPTGDILPKGGAPVEGYGVRRYQCKESSVIESRTVGGPGQEVTALLIFELLSMG